MYHLCKPVDNDEGRIVALVLSRVRHKQFRLSRDLYEPVDDDENYIITRILPMT